MKTKCIQYDGVITLNSRGWLGFNVDCVYFYLLGCVLKEIVKRMNVNRY